MSDFIVNTNLSLSKPRTSKHYCYKALGARAIA
jgi:hypothetical protein